MPIPQAKTKLIFDDRYKKKDGTSAVRLRVTLKKQQKYYTLKVYLTKKEWLAMHNPNAKRANKDRMLYLNTLEAKAIRIINELEPFTFSQFEKEFNKQVPENGSIPVLMNQYIDKLRYRDQYNTADNYQSALSSFKVFHKENKDYSLEIIEVNPEWLYAYQKWMESNDKSLTTIGIYVRYLRTIINIAIEEGIMKRDAYPFGKRKYIIPHGSNNKRALTKNEIDKIRYFVPRSEEEYKARDIFLISFWANGINMKDIALLKFANLHSDSIVYIRAKTARSKQNFTQETAIPLYPQLIFLIEKWGQKDKVYNNYIFDVVSKDDSKEKKTAKIKQFTKTTNKYLKRIGQSLNLPIKLTTYVARHTCATLLHKAGASEEDICEILGQTDVETTRKYLASLGIAKYGKYYEELY
ncbi:MAG: site-specific integrase [Carboxylicivirga sp.]|jgi:site-specific recombinase XerD|nr:site-specific integrase [Carboxylicivirga sp.]